MQPCYDNMNSLSCTLEKTPTYVRTYRELNLVRALDEDTEFSPFTCALLHCARQLFLGIQFVRYKLYLTQYVPM